MTGARECGMVCRLPNSFFCGAGLGIGVWVCSLPSVYQSEARRGDAAL